MNAIRNAIRRATRVDARRRGSVLLFSVIVVLLLTMMGAAYLQMARVDRRATRAVDTRSQDVDGSIIRFIANILAADVLQEDGEQYDYPWTNDGANFEVKDFLDPGNNLSTNAQGGEKDDMWLGVIEPTFSGGNVASWPHLTNLRGVWLDLSAVGPNPTYGAGDYPAQYATTADNDPNTGDTDVAYNANPDIMPDASGDGIGDSRWTWAPLPQELGRRYVMAVRIIDNSALANLNVWTQTAASGTEASRWYWPAELNLGTVFDNWSASGVYQAVMNDRKLAAAPSFEDRYWFWLDAARMGPVAYGEADDLGDWDRIGNGTTEENMGTPPATDYERFGIEDEIELRWRNGLNKSSDNATADPDSPLEEITTAIGAPLWRSTAVETNWNDASGSQQQFFEAEPRKHFTTYSGSSLRWKATLNPRTDDERERLVEIASDVAALEMPTVGAATAPSWTADEFGNQFLATLLDWIDYRDDAGQKKPDNHLTKVGDRYGMEYLPFISEVYVQAEFQDPDLDDTWDRVGGIAFGIEIVNPFPVEISVKDLHLLVNGADWGLLTDLLPGLTNETLDPSEVVLLYLNAGASTIGSGDPGEYEVTTQSWPSGGTAEFEVSLQAMDEDGAPIIYQKFKGCEMPTQFVEPNAAFDGQPIYEKYSYRGTANGLNAMVVRYADLTLLPSRVLSASPDAQFGTVNKGAGFDTVLTDATDLATMPTAGDEPFLIGNAGRIYRAGDIARMVFVGPTESKPFAEMWNARTKVTDHMLDFASTTMAGSGSEAVNAAVLLLGKLTTLVPENDDAWALVPGLININTASERMLNWALPEFSNKAAFATDVVSGRKTPKGSVVSERSNPGFAYVGEVAGLGSTGFEDFNEYEPTKAPGDSDDYSGDAEENTIGLANLNQVLTTSSDVFTAYIVVRGYKSDDFSSAGKQEEYRLIAVFDRSGVTEERPMARVLGVAVIRQP